MKRRVKKVSASVIAKTHDEEGRLILAEGNGVRIVYDPGHEYHPAVYRKTTDKEWLRIAKEERGRVHQSTE